MQQCTHSSNTGSGPFCTQCGERLNPQPVFKPVKQSLLTSTNVIIAFFVAVAGFAIFAIFADSMSSTVDNSSSDFATDIARETPTESQSLIVEAPGMPVMIIQPTFMLYADTKSILDNSDSQRTNNHYKVSTSTYNQIQNLALPRTEENIARVAHWNKQWEHWENVDAFQENTTSISEDHIIDKEESQHICFALDQWTTQMTEAITYVQDYRKADPQTVEKNPGLGNLEHEANRALELLNQIECE